MLDEMSSTISTQAGEARDPVKGHRRRGAVLAGLLFASSAPFVGLTADTAGAAGPTPSSVILYTNNDGGPTPIFPATVYSVAGEPVALVAAVFATDGNALKPTGTVIFKDAGAVLSTTNVSNGIAVHIVEPIFGPHLFTAEYSGDVVYTAATGNPVNQVAQNDCSVATGDLGFPGPSVFANGVWYQRTPYDSGPVGKCFLWGSAGQLPVLGDWDKDGKPTIGVYDRGRWMMSNRSKSGPVDIDFVWGQAGMAPVVGDWDGDGRDTIGLYKDGVWYFRNSNASGGIDNTFAWGGAGMIPVVGDWDGDGRDTIGLYKDGVWYLRNTNAPGGIDLMIVWGGATDQPISGDWNGDGKDTIGVYRAGQWYMRNTNASGGIDVEFSWGDASMTATPGR